MRGFNDESDERLIALYVEGDNNAFDALVERHKVRVYTYICGYVKDEELADDIFQETFVKVISTIKQGRYVENGRFADGKAIHRLMEKDRPFPQDGKPLSHSAARLGRLPTVPQRLRLLLPQKLRSLIEKIIISW